MFLGERYRWHVKDYAQLEDQLRVAPAESRDISPGGILGGKASSRQNSIVALIHHHHVCILDGKPH